LKRDHEYDSINEVKKYVKHFRRKFSGSIGKPFKFIEWFFTKGFKLYLQFFPVIPHLFPLEWKSTFDDATLTWHIFELKDDYYCSENPPDTAFEEHTSISFEQDLHRLIEDKTQEALSPIKDVKAKEFDKRSFLRTLQDHVYDATHNISLNEVKASVTDPRVIEYFKHAHGYFIQAVLQYQRRLSLKYTEQAANRRAKATNSKNKSLIDINHPPSDEVLKLIYAFHTNKQRFVNPQAMKYETFKSIVISPSLAIQEKEGLYIEFACETKIAIDLLWQLQNEKIIPNACDWPMISDYKILRSKNGTVLKPRHASSTLSEIKKGLVSKASPEIEKLIHKIKG
jgi:hypothetical protein